MPLSTYRQHAGNLEDVISREGGHERDDGNTQRDDLPDGDVGGAHRRAQHQGVSQWSVGRLQVSRAVIKGNPILSMLHSEQDRSSSLRCRLW